MKLVTPLPISCGRSRTEHSRATYTFRADSWVFLTAPKAVKTKICQDASNPACRSTPTIAGPDRSGVGLARFTGSVLRRPAALEARAGALECGDLPPHSYSLEAVGPRAIRDDRRYLAGLHRSTGHR
jgi:hypothetical protein